MSLKEDQRLLADAVMDSSRLELINILTKGDPQYISELSKVVKMDRATLAYHLDILERVGLVESEYVVLQEPKSKGRAARYYHVNTKKLSEAIQIIEKLLPSK